MEPEEQAENILQALEREDVFKALMRVGDFREKVIKELEEEYKGDLDHIWQKGFDDGYDKGYKTGQAKGKEEGLAEGVELAASRIEGRADIPLDVRRKVTNFARGYY